MGDEDGPVMDWPGQVADIWKQEIDAAYGRARRAIEGDFAERGVPSSAGEEVGRLTEQRDRLHKLVDAAAERARDKDQDPTFMLNLRSIIPPEWYAWPFVSKALVVGRMLRDEAAGRGRL